MITTVPTPTYTADNAVIYSQISTTRNASNSGLLAQSSALDTAAANHAGFLVTNNLANNYTYLGSSFGGTQGGHYETTSYNSVSLSGFTGATPGARAGFAGYTGTVIEEVSFGAASGAACLDSLLNSVYHLIQIMSSATQIGLSFNPGNSIDTVCVIELGTPSTTAGQLPATSATTVYPFNGQTNVATAYATASELPQVPVASSFILTGQPVVINLYSLVNQTIAAGNLVINSFTVTPGNTGVAVPATILTSAGVTVPANSSVVLTADPNLLQPGIVVLLPDAPLQGGAIVYSVAFNATVNGHSVAYSWNFTTR